MTKQTKKIRKTIYDRPLPPVNVNLSRPALALLMELYYYPYISEDRLSQNGMIAMKELTYNGLAHFGRAEAAMCSAPSCRLIIIDSRGKKYAKWVEAHGGYVPAHTVMRYF